MMAGNRNKVFPAMSVKRQPPSIADACRRRATITRKWDSLEKELNSNANVTSHMAAKRQQSETMSTSTFDDVSSTSSSYQTTPSPMNVYHRGNRSERRNARNKKKKPEPPKKKEKEKDATTLLVDKLHSSLDNLDRFLQTNLQDEIFLARKDMMPKHFEKSEKLRSRWKKLEQDLVYEELLVTISDAKDRKKSTGSNPLTPIGEEPEEKGPKSATSDSHRLSPEGASSHDNDVEHEKSSSTKGKGSSKGKPKGRKEGVYGNESEVEKHHTKADVHHVPEQRRTSTLSRNTDVDVPLGDVPSEEEYHSQEHRSSQKISTQSDISLKRKPTFEGSKDSLEKRVSTVSNHSYTQSRQTSVLSKQSKSNTTLLSKQSTIVSTQSTTIGDELAEEEEDEELSEEDDEENIEDDDDEEIEENDDVSVEEDGEEVEEDQEEEDEEELEEDEEELEEDEEELEEDEEEVEDDVEEVEDLQPLMESVKNVRDDSQIKSMVGADVEDDETVTENEKLKEAEIAQEAVSERDSVSQCSPGRKDSTEEEEENEHDEGNDGTENDDDEEEETGTEEETGEEEEEIMEEEGEKTKRNSVIVSESRSEIDRPPVLKANVLKRQENVQEDRPVLDKGTTNSTSVDNYVEKENDLDEEGLNSEEDDNDDDTDEEDENDVEEDDEEVNECENSEGNVGDDDEEKEEEKIEIAANKIEVKMSHKMSEGPTENKIYENDQDTEEIKTPLDIQILPTDSTQSPKKKSISKKDTISEQSVFSNVRSVVDCVLSEKKTSIVKSNNQNPQNINNVDKNQNSIENQNQKKRSTSPETLMGDGGVYIHRPKKQRKKERPPSTPHSRHGKRRGKYEENPYIATANEIRRQIHPSRAEPDTKTKDHKPHSKKGKVPKILGLVNELCSPRVHMTASPSTRKDNHISPRSRLSSQSEIDKRERNKRQSKSKSPASKFPSPRDRSRKRNVSDKSKEPALLSVSTEMMTLHKDKIHANSKDRSPRHTHTKPRKTKKNGKLKKETDLSSENQEALYPPNEPITRVRKQGGVNLNQATNKTDNDKSEVEIRKKELCKSDDSAISKADKFSACKEGGVESIHEQTEMGTVRTKYNDDSNKPDRTSKDKTQRKSVICSDETVSSFRIRNKISKQEESSANAPERQPERKVKKSRKSKGQIVHEQKDPSSRDEGMDVMNYVCKSRIVYDRDQVKKINSTDTVKLKPSHVRRAKKSVVRAEGVNTDTVTSVYDGKVEVRNAGAKHKKKGKDKTKKGVQKSYSIVDLESQATSEGSEGSSKHRLESQPAAPKPSKEMMERAREAKEVYTPPRPSLGEKRAERVKVVEEIRAEEKRQEDRIRRKKKHDTEKKKSKPKK